MVPEQAVDNGSRPRGRPAISRRLLLTGTAALATTGVVGAASGCSRVATADTGDGGHLLQQLRARGTVRLGIAGEQPYGYIGKDGEITGSAPAIATRIFQRLGVERVEPFPTEFGSLIFGLNSLQFDVVAAGMYINPERCEQVLFADPEYQMKDAFIVRKGNPMNLRTYEDIARTGARMATGIGYAEIDYAKEAGVKKIDTLPDQLLGLPRRFHALGDSASSSSACRTTARASPMTMESSSSRRRRWKPRWPRWATTSATGPTPARSPCRTPPMSGSR